MAFISTAAFAVKPPGHGGASQGMMGGAAAASENQLKSGNSPATGSKGAATPKDDKIRVPKATGPNATTVEGVFANLAKLDKKKVVIRAKVVKVSSNIMDKNWVHIQDGTGTQAKGNHNLVCTSSETPKLGAIVTVSGRLAKDRDFGSGYRYNAIVEETTFKK